MCFFSGPPPPPSPLLAVSLYYLAIYSLLDEFHAKHGRYRGGGGGRNLRNKSVCISETRDSAVAVRQRNNNGMDGITSDQDRDASISTTARENCKQEDGKAGTPLPAIGPSPPAEPVPERTPYGAAGVARRRSMFTGEDNPASTAGSGSSVRGDEGNSVALPTLVKPFHVCVCCGAEGGLGHGRRCLHTFRRCGFCRVEEVQRVLGIQDIGRRGRRGTSTPVSEERCA